MSTHADFLRAVLTQERVEDRAQGAECSANVHPVNWDPQRFANEQLRGLVQQVFLSQDSESNRQVVFSAVDPHTRIRELCLQVGEALAEQEGKRVCIVDALKNLGEEDKTHGRKTSEPNLSRESEALCGSSRQISNRLWLIPSETFWSGHADYFSAEVPRRRLDQLRSEFDYCVIQAPAVGVSGIAGLLGRLSDGLVLVLEAHSTRRLAAQKAQMSLQAANARLLGTVLSERTFPIPQKLYRRL
jgi:hypothetical protein